MLRSHISSRRRGGVHCRFDRKTTPSSREADASRYFLDRSATPPCGDARRGICLTTNLRLIWTVLPCEEGLRQKHYVEQHHSMVDYEQTHRRGWGRATSYLWRHP